MTEFILFNEQVLVGPDWVAPEDEEEAINLSVNKWQFVVESLESSTSLVNDGGWTTCALCQIYDRGNHERCYGCPVVERTGLPGCENTPYREYREALKRGDRTAALDAARREVEFLQSLENDPEKS